MRGRLLLMAMNKAIEHGKEKRQPYRGSKVFDKTCRNHGGCDWCKENRTIAYTKETLKMDSKEDEWEDEDGHGR